VDAHTFALAYGLSSIAGLRASLTVLAVCIAVRAHALIPPHSLEWLASDTTFIVLIALTVADFLGDKIPVVDNVLHAVHTVLAPAAGGIAAAALDPSGGTGAALLGIVGGANALGIHATKSATRVGTSAISLGFLTPIVSAIEDVVAIGALVVAFLAPFVMAAIAVITTAVVVILGRRIVASLQRKLRATVGLQPSPDLNLH
jgi:hypothetical protein